jgi:hypothetical protein
MDALTATVLAESAALAALSVKHFFGKKISADVEGMKAEILKARADAASAYAKVLQRDKVIVQDAEHKICDSCGLLVARFKTICANCEVK